MIQIIRLHMDYLKAFAVEPEPRDEDDWTEEDEADMERIVKEIDALTDLERPDRGERRGKDRRMGEEDSEHAEDEQD